MKKRSLIIALIAVAILNISGCESKSEKAQRELQEKKEQVESTNREIRELEEQVERNNQRIKELQGN